MSFLDQQNVNNAPKRICKPLKGGLFEAYPPTSLDGHDRAGYVYQGRPCPTVASYDPDYCIPGALKIQANPFGEHKEASLGMIQAALNCSFGVSTDELRTEAENALKANLWRAADADLVAILAAEAVLQAGGSDPVCVLGRAAQFLASSGYCGTGVILGSVDWFIRLALFNHVTWEGNHYEDGVGNIIIPMSINTNGLVYAFDSEVDVKVSDIQLLDEPMPGQRTINDRIVRAEQLFTVAIDACAVGSFQTAPC